jgi:hypothetical protein
MLAARRHGRLAFPCRLQQYRPGSMLAANAWADIDVQLKRRHDLIPAVAA